MGGCGERGDDRGEEGKGQVSGERAVGDVSMMVSKAMRCGLVGAIVRADGKEGECALGGRVWKRADG